MEIVTGIVAFGVIFLLTWVVNKGKKAASRALAQKVFYRKQFETGKHLLQGLTFETSASPSTLMRQLESRVAVSDRPAGLAAQLYSVHSQGSRMDFVYGNKFSDNFRARVALLEDHGRTLGVFKVIRWHERDGVVLSQDWMFTLFEQVKAVVLAADPAATFSEGIDDKRLRSATAADTHEEPKEAAVAPEATITPPAEGPAPIAAPTRQMNNLSYVGVAIVFADLVWIGAFGVEWALLPVWLVVLAIGGGIIHYSTSPGRKASDGGQAAQSGTAAQIAPAAQAGSNTAPIAPAADAIDELTAPEPTAEEFALAAEELGAAAEEQSVAAGPGTAPARIAIPAKLGLWIVVAISAFLIVGVIGAGFLSKLGKPSSTSGVASASTSAPDADTPSAGDDVSALEGDTADFVAWVEQEGGVLLISAEPGGERVYSRPSIIMLRSSEPFFEWAIPLADAYDYRIGSRSVSGYELFEYVCLEGLVTVEVACDEGRIESILCWDESETIRDDVAYLNEFLSTAPSSGDKQFSTVYYNAQASAACGRIVFNTDDLLYTISIPSYEVEQLTVDGVAVSSDGFVEAISERGGMGTIIYTQDGIQLMTLDGAE